MDSEVLLGNDVEGNLSGDEIDLDEGLLLDTLKNSDSDETGIANRARHRQYPEFNIETDMVDH